MFYYVSAFVSFLCGDVSVGMCLQTCACSCGSQRSTFAVIPWAVHFIFDSLTGLKLTMKVKPGNPEDPPVSPSPGFLGSNSGPQTFKVTLYPLSFQNLLPFYS